MWLLEYMVMVSSQFSSKLMLKLLSYLVQALYFTDYHVRLTTYLKAISFTATKNPSVKGCFVCHTGNVILTSDLLLNGREGSIFCQLLSREKGI